ncbi:HK97 family phage prohead protease [Alicyclobacillus sp. ALC3]|uniref:HK97 family phage prohead protease n=1 Tax=Alicyclobacillus sp. ALC3 TaxID=2796143 RepID=UPI0023784E4F|nr:HK97 family phage prohead protease [Alicyclobacillus sp. ALC3]WDL98133.1 HK97 family phage prohead protease [Alicyclobacillus sp. ALC3]
MGVAAKLTWPLAPRDTKWSASEANKRIVEWATGEDGKIDYLKYASTHFWFDSDAPDPDKDGVPDRQGDYKLPFCDVIDGKVMAVPKGVFGDAAAIQGSRGGVKIPDEDVKHVKQAIEQYYNKMAKEFKDEGIVAPWQKNKKSATWRTALVTDLRAGDPNVTDDPGGRIQGHAAVYGQRANIGGWFEEIIAPGAFDGADLTDVPFFVNHDTNDIPLARSRRNNGNSTMTLSTDNQGLAFDATLDVENYDKARALYSAVQRGDIDKMSYGFMVAEDEWTGLDTGLPLRTIRKIGKVFEISAVTFPAYDGTDIQAASRDAHTLESVRALLESNQSALESEKREAEVLRLKAQILAGS